MKFMSNILFNIMMGILFVFVSIWYFIIYLIDIFCDLVEEGTQKIKKLRK